MDDDIKLNTSDCPNHRYDNRYESLDHKQSKEDIFESIQSTLKDSEFSVKKSYELRNDSDDYAVRKSIDIDIGHENIDMSLSQKVDNLENMDKNYQNSC